MRAADGQAADAPAVRVLLFAGLRQAMGWSERRVVLDGALARAGEATPLGLWQRLELSRGWPPSAGSAASSSIHAMEVAPDPPGDAADNANAAIAPAVLHAAAAQAQALPSGIRVAINQRFADPLTPLADGDELAFLPPISGG